MTCYPESVNYVGFGDALARYGQSGNGRSSAAALLMLSALSVLVLIGEPDAVVPQRFVRLVGADDANLKSFESLFTSGKPRCGQARDTQREFLFGTDSPDIGSVALVPLGDHGSLGVLALGSTDRDRFHPGMSTDFLARLADLISDVLSRP